MYCDYNALAGYATTLNNNFNQIKKAMTSIESSFKTIVSSNNWNADTRDYFYEMLSTVFNNFDALNNKFMNVTQYLDNVIDNYKSFDSASFGG